MTTRVKTKRGALLLFLCFILALSACSSSLAGSARVRYVIDGDTIVLSNGKKVRYLGINAPEIPHKDSPRGEPLGMAAKEFNKDLVEGKVVHLEYGRVKRDRFGRLLAFVFLRDGRMVNELLVRKGLAFVCLFDKHLKYRQRLLSAQREAITRGVGIWGLPVERPERYYIGNKKTLRFHRPWCAYGRKTAPRNRIIFRDRKRAFLKGYCRCKKCLP